MKSAKAEFNARETKMISNFSQNEELKQQENETLRNELVEQSVQFNKSRNCWTKRKRSSRVLKRTQKKIASKR